MSTRPRLGALSEPAINKLPSKYWGSRRAHDPPHDLQPATREEHEARSAKLQKNCQLARCLQLLKSIEVQVGNVRDALNAAAVLDSDTVDLPKVARRAQHALVELDGVLAGVEREGGLQVGEAS